VWEAARAQTFTNSPRLAESLRNRKSNRSHELSLDFRGNAEKNQASILCQFEIGAMSARFSICSR
jgi:hypothetical protein